MRAVAFGAGIIAALGMVSVAVAAMDDPDSPVATARYTVAPDVATQAAVTTDAPEVSPPASTEPARRFNMATEDARSHVDATNGQLTGLDTYPAAARRGTALRPTRISGSMERILQDANLRRGFGEMRAIGEQARLFLFAGDQGGVWTYSFTHDRGGVKASGWATERADGVGEQRLGVAWQSGRTRLSLSGVERKFCQFGAEMKDRVVALTLSFSPGWSSKRDRQPS
jgi:hypothetical protein